MPPLPRTSHSRPAEASHSVDRPRVFPFACIVLAAGDGTRYGMPKVAATLPDGRRFVDEVARTANDAGASPVIVVVPPGQGAPAGTRAVENNDPNSEQIASLRLGLRELSRAPVCGMLVWPVDCPIVRVETVLAIVDAARRTGRAAIVPVYCGSRGHPSYFARELWPELMAVLDGGARAVLHQHHELVLELEVTDGGILADFDTRAANLSAQPSAHVL